MTSNIHAMRTDFNEGMERVHRLLEQAGEALQRVGAFLQRIDMSFKAEKKEDGLLYAPDGRRVYEFTCPGCGHEAVAAQSFMMQMGINGGCGSCSQCNLFLHLEITPDLDGEAMVAIPHADYLLRVEKEDLEREAVL